MPFQLTVLDKEIPKDPFVVDMLEHLRILK